MYYLELQQASYIRNNMERMDTGFIFVKSSELCEGIKLRSKVKIEIFHFRKSELCRTILLFRRPRLVIFANAMFYKNSCFDSSKEITNAFAYHF